MGNAIEGHPCRVLVAPVDVLLVNSDCAEDDVDTVVQPDVLVVCDPAKVTPRGIRGAPDWVLEVISPASASHDQIIKPAAYERAGVLPGVVVRWEPIVARLLPAGDTPWSRP